MKTVILYIRRTQNALLHWVLLTVILGITYFVYKPGLSGPFVFDDYANIIRNESLRISELSLDSMRSILNSVPNGVYGRPLSMYSFAVNYYWDRNLISPFPVSDTFKITNLIIHLLNGVALFVLSRLIIDASDRRSGNIRSTLEINWISLAVAAAWLLHPFNLTSVLYVVQRMTSLASLFIMLGMAVYLYGRQRFEKNQTYAHTLMVAAIVIFTPLAFLCKEIGIMLPAYLALIELTLLRRIELTVNSKRFIALYFILFVLIPIFTGMAYLISSPELILSGYVKREFNITERVLTEFRVIWLYIFQTILPNIKIMGLFHDDIQISKSIIEPFNTLLSLFGLIAILILAIKNVKKCPLLGFGLIFFLAAHSLESTLIPLELVHEHRNYLPSTGLILVVFNFLLGKPSDKRAVNLYRLVAALFLLLFPTITISRTLDWSSAQRLWQAETQNHPKSVRAQISLASYYSGMVTANPQMREDSKKIAKEAYLKVLSIDESNTTALFGLISLNDRDDQKLNIQYLAKLENSLRTSLLPVDTNDSLIEMARCIKDRNCKVNKEQLEALLDAALDNHKLKGRERALIYSAQTYYLTTVAQDFPRALQSVKKSIELDGDIEHQMWLANILLAMRDIPSAKNQITLLRSLDRYHSKENNIKQLEAQLAVVSK